MDRRRRTMAARLGPPKLLLVSSILMSQSAGQVLTANTLSTIEFDAADETGATWGLSSGVVTVPAGITAISYSFLCRSTALTAANTINSQIVINGSTVKALPVFDEQVRGPAYIHGAMAVTAGQNIRFKINSVTVGFTTRDTHTKAHIWGYA